VKGIAHFASGLAAASFFPEAIDAAVVGNPLYFLIGGFFGLLPDTLDFKLLRYFVKHDVEIAPDPLNPDAFLIANAFAEAVAETYASKNELCIKLHSVRIAADRWLAYRLKVDRVRNSIRVSFGETLDTGGNPDAPMDTEVCSAEVVLPVDVVMDYGYVVDIGFLEGPTLRLRAHAGYVESTFIHWHRSWSHGIPFALLVGTVLGFATGWVVGVIATVSLLLHAMMDYAGYMGGSLFAPFSWERRPGFKLCRSGDSLWNFAVVWSAGMLILWNVGAHSLYTAGLGHYVVWAICLPILIARFLLR
jgi:hypothetical protein